MTKFTKRQIFTVQVYNRNTSNWETTYFFTDYEEAKKECLSYVIASRVIFMNRIEFRNAVSAKR